MNKPNENVKNYVTNTYKEKNQIGRRFSKIFEILTDPGYYEGTKYAKYFYRLNEDGTSKIYVKDPMEKELEDVIKEPRNQMKYLVGLAGMGKTTLLRNFFKITDRDIKIHENNIIIYISFYNANLSTDSPQKSIEEEVTNYLSRTVKKLLSKHKEIVKDKKNFWKDFYDFMENNKPTLLTNEKLTPTSCFLEELVDELSYDRKLQQLDTVCNLKPIEYYSSFIKYILSKLKKQYHIILIYDDIEAKAGIFHSALIEVARHIHACFCAIENQERTVKTIVALRAYTFRSNIERQSNARREILQKDTILKKSTVNLHAIFDKRFNEIEQIEQIEKVIKKIDSYKEARRQLKYVEQKLDKICGELIYNLSNYNLCDAMILYCNVLINVEWIACDETENKGAFKINAENYQLTTENIIYTIANGNSKEYTNDNYNFVPNLLYNHIEGSDLIGLYIIRYLIQNNIVNIYGIKYAEGNAILSDIMGLFVSSTDSETRIANWRGRILGLLEYLYDSGVLLRSLYDIEDSTEKQIERKYSNTHKLYLSPRGSILYNLLSQNAVLLELYRDDIYTDLPNNNKTTSQLNTYTLFEYLIDYISELFQCEKRNISNAISNLNKYQELIGREFITAELLKGIVKNLYTYFKDEGNDYYKMIEKVREIVKDMQFYSVALKEKKDVYFIISEYLKNI